MYLPACYDVICKMSYRAHSAIQRINLLNYNQILERLPGIKLELLAYKENKVYGWTILDGIEVKDTISCGHYSTNVHGLNTVIPYGEKLSFVTLPSNFKLPPVKNYQDYFIGVSGLKTIDLELPFKKGQKKLDLDFYIVKRRWLNKFSVKWNIDGRSFNYKDWFVDFHIKQEEYIHEYYSNTIDVYLMHCMLRSSYLVPLVFGTEKLDLKGDIRVPFETAWIYQLLYGRDNDVFFQLRSGERMYFNSLKVGGRTGHQKYQKIDVKLRGVSSPVLIRGNFAVRFKI